MSLFPASRMVLTRQALLPVPRSALLRFKGTTSSPSPLEIPNHSVATATPAANSVTAFPETEPEAPSDFATSAYSPTNVIPVQRGENDALDAASISGAPLDLQARTVRIYKPSKAATQSGNWNERQWRMDWDVLSRGHRWENPLMGWQSSGDSMQGTHIFFKSREDAVAFAEKQGYKWLIQEPNERAFRAKTYSANFFHSPKELKIIRTK
ncbi:ETC complex I subunit conserved region-domain-containing protein [Tuber borchii]|uniref:NADH dehydrogenase [ubiquinone] iron-sulfur protein 4, mitochondrial n=1 Tax=Tuber borchii TaxID=42251 RepID=A0A2T6ZXG6_TUBBO|nr:ETC complex I subunit conserved region-domain-containing protein [Tuber borchii]